VFDSGRLKSEVQDQGYAVISLDLPPSTITQAEQAVYDCLAISKLHPDSWDHAGVDHRGFAPLWNAEVLWRIRASKLLHVIFAALYDTEDLWVSIDRCHFKPPASRDQRVGLSWFLHWDADSDSPTFLRYQGVLALADTPAFQGCFGCSPDVFHMVKTEGYAAAEKLTGSGQFEVRQVACRSGDLIVWDHRLLHGNTPNLGVLPRVAMYVAMKPSGNRAELAARTRAWSTGTWPYLNGGPAYNDERRPSVEQYWTEALGVDVNG
jgi:hypothetical protein